MENFILCAVTSQEIDPLIDVILQGDIIQIGRYQGLGSIFCRKTCFRVLHVISYGCLLPHECSLNFLQEKRNRG